MILPRILLTHKVYLSYLENTVSHNGGEYKEHLNKPVDAFIWSNTKEGHQFWSNIADLKTDFVVVCDMRGHRPNKSRVIDFKKINKKSW